MSIRRKHPLKSLYGVGINDADYELSICVEVDGKMKQVWVCPYYQKWKSMFSRCYSEKYLLRMPSYAGCYVDERWHYFMQFREWMAAQDWKDKHLDKDLLMEGNRCYGPDTCVFIDASVNLFVAGFDVNKSKLPKGVTWQTQINRYQVRCKDVNTGKNKHLGTFLDLSEAEQAYKEFKYQQAIILADQQEDPRVAQALLDRYKV